MPSPSEFIELFNIQLKSHREYGHISGIIDTLHNLAVMEAYSQNMSASLAYLNEAEQLLRDLDEKRLTQICAELRTGNLEVAHHFVTTRTLKLAGLREKLQQKK